MDVWLIAKDGSFLRPTTDQATVGAVDGIAVVTVAIIDMVEGLAAADFAAGNAAGSDSKEDGDLGLCLSRCCCCFSCWTCCCCSGCDGNAAMLAVVIDAHLLVAAAVMELSYKIHCTDSSCLQSWSGSLRVTRRIPCC